MAFTGMRRPLSWWLARAGWALALAAAFAAGWWLMLAYAGLQGG
jgi:hypothetical protein